MDLGGSERVERSVEKLHSLYTEHGRTAGPAAFGHMLRLAQDVQHPNPNPNPNPNPIPNLTLTLTYAGRAASGARQAAAAADGGAAAAHQPRAARRAV